MEGTILKVCVERFNHVVDEFEETQFVNVVFNVNGYYEVQRSIPPVNDFVLSVF